MHRVRTAPHAPSLSHPIAPAGGPSLSVQRLHFPPCPLPAHALGANHVIATIPSSAAAGGKLFGRLAAILP